MRLPITMGVCGALLAVCLAVLPAASAAPETLREMEVMGVAADPASGAPVVFLRGKTDRRELNIFIGPCEAQAIAAPLQGIQPPRPQTHDLVVEIVHKLQARVKRAVITELKAQTYHAELVLEAGGRELVLDARPSDGIALALRENAPVWAAESILGPPPPPGPRDPLERRTP